ncbi:ATP-binding protein [Streptomyces sp. CO7]
MGGKNRARRKGRKNGTTQGSGQGPTGRAVRNDFRGAGFTDSQVVGQGTLKIKNVQRFAPVPTALDALPRLPAGFTGREDDIAFTLGVLDPDRPDDGPATAVLSGWGGVGKTTLAHAAGHAAKERGWFTGVLLIDLRGYDSHPVQADDALEAFLLSLGVRPKHLPPPGPVREALYRSLLGDRQRAGQRLLIVADNASQAAQVEPLVPPGHHGMLVTSRHRLPGLGRMRTVDQLRPEDAVALLDAALRSNDPDDPRVREDPRAAERVALACGYLPLALQITAALLVQDPGQPLSERADALTQEESVLDGLDDGERSLRSVFDQSLQRLLPQEQDLFRLLSLNPGPDISTAAATVLAGRPRPATERLLARLAAGHLVERNPAARDRWRMHDLLHAYAHEQAEGVTARSRDALRRYGKARAGLIYHYVEHAKAAGTHLDPPGSPVSPRFPDREQALAWLDSERENLVAAARTTPPLVGRELGFALPTYLRWRRRLRDCLVVCSLALDACKVLEDPHNEAVAWNNLGTALRALRRFEEALDAHTTARGLYRKTGYTHGEAVAWNNLGSTLGKLRRFEEALHAYTTARGLFRQTGSTNDEAGVLNNLGGALHEVGRSEEALHAYATALGLYQQMGDTLGEAVVRNNLGGVLHLMGRFEEALEAHTAALGFRQEAGDTHGEAVVRHNLGGTLDALGRFEEALEAHTTALGLYQETDDTYGAAMAWNNLGSALRGLGRFDEAVEAGQRAADMLAEAQDWFGTGEAWSELATTLALAGADGTRVRDAWHASASAYTRAGAEEEAATSRACAEGATDPDDRDEAPGGRTG